MDSPASIAEGEQVPTFTSPKYIPSPAATRSASRVRIITPAAGIYLFPNADKREPQRASRVRDVLTGALAASGMEWGCMMQERI